VLITTIMVTITAHVSVLIINHYPATRRHASANPGIPCLDYVDCRFRGGPDRVQQQGPDPLEVTSWQSIMTQWLPAGCITQYPVWQSNFIMHSITNKQ